MNGGFHLGKLSGIDINIDWSWFFIFFLVTWNLAAGIFPRFHPEWGIFLTWSISITASLLFFASVLAHELAHSIVAKAQGLPVNKIVLFLFGGVSNLQKEPESPKTEFFMAVIGPLTSIFLGILFLTLSGAGTSIITANINDPLTVLSGLNPVQTLLFWLGPVNILVGLFNLIPGFPLDGGRVLRSFIWGITNDLQKATLYASTVGQMVAWGFILIGVSMAVGINVPFFGSGIIGGIWLIIIGWFLRNAASQSYQRVVIKDVLDGVPISRLMRKNFDTVLPDITIEELLYNHILGKEDRAFPVMMDGKLEGIVSLDDVSKETNDMWDKTKVEEIMTPASELEKVNFKEDASDALDKLVAKDVGQLPVVKNGKIIGIVNRRDLLIWIELHSKEGNISSV